MENDDFVTNLIKNYSLTESPVVKVTFEEKVNIVQELVEIVNNDDDDIDKNISIQPIV